MNLTVVLVNHGTETVTAANLTVRDIRPNGTSMILGSIHVPTPLAPAASVTMVFGPFLAGGVGDHILRIAVTDVTPAPAGSGAHSMDLSMHVSAYVPPPPPPVKHPDLVPIAGTVSPPEPTRGADVNLTVYVLNRGDLAATGASLMVYDNTTDGTAFLGSVALAEPLAPSAVEVVAFGPFHAGAVGNHSLRVVITNVNPPEANVSNNMLQIPMTVIRAPPNQGPGGGTGGTFDMGALVIAALVGAGIAAAVGTTVYFMRPGPSGPAEPPPPEPPDFSPRAIWPP